MRPFWYVLDNEFRPRPAAGIEEFSRWMDANLAQRRVGSTFVYADGTAVDEKPEDQVKAERPEGCAWVSTIFTGMDSNFDNDPPKLFETQVFGSPGNEDLRFWTPSWESALAQHGFVVEWLQAVRRIKL